jgi:cold shock CspA family protein
MPGELYMGTGTPLRHGRVAAFDAAAGTGTVTADDGTTYPFHCIEIADGSRTIDSGTPVEFVLLAKFGRYQAAQLRPG